MAIIHNRKRESPYVTLDTSALNDPDLSWKAKAIHAYLISKPADWRVYVRHLAKQSSDGRHATMTGLQELVEAGYVDRKQSRTEEGTFADTKYIVYESLEEKEAIKAGEEPDEPEEPAVQKPDHGEMENDLTAFRFSAYGLSGYGFSANGKPDTSNNGSIPIIDLTKDGRKDDTTSSRSNTPASEREASQASTRPSSQPDDQKSKQEMRDPENIDWSFLTERDRKQLGHIKNNWELLVNTEGLNGRVMAMERLNQLTFGGITMNMSQRRIMVDVIERYGWPGVVAACTIGSRKGMNLADIEAIADFWDKSDDEIRTEQMPDGMAEALRKEREAMQSQ